MAMVVVAGILLVCLGLLLGHAWTTQLFQHRFRQHAEERRRLNAQWKVVRAAGRRRSGCTECAARRSELDGYLRHPEARLADEV